MYTQSYRHFINTRLLLVVFLATLSACGSTRPYTSGPVKTFDPDNQHLPEPPETEEHFEWESLYLSTFYQVEKNLDLGRLFQNIGRLIGITGRDEAKNVNVLDEVPNSSWYTHRHYTDPMTSRELKQGPVKPGETPDTSRAIAVIRGKSDGVTPGFTIKDARDNIFIIKIDQPDYPELQSSSEVIATNIFYAAGYFVPQNSITYLDPQQLFIDEDATVTKDGKEQPMTAADLQEILNKAYIRGDGKVRVLASKFVDGKPIGPWNFMGLLKGDPNDRVPHEDRREVRGLRVLASWLNDTDRRHANTMAVYINEEGNNYIRHYLLDMGSTLGTTGNTLKQTKRGQEYRYDPRYMGLLYASLGLYVKPWARPEAKNRPYYPAVGYYEAELFDPGNWVTSYPNPAFEKATPRDGFWGAKIVMSFTDDDIRALVEAGQISDPNAAGYLTETLIKRRDKIGEYWFGRMNPLDKFKVWQKGEELRLSFSDLSVEGGLAEPSAHRYLYSVSVDGKPLFRNRIAEEPEIVFNTGTKAGPKQIVRVELHTLREYRDGRGKKIDVYVELQNGNARLVGIDREG